MVKGSLVRHSLGKAGASAHLWQYILPTEMVTLRS